jgi:hypothetical protein
LEAVSDVSVRLLARMFAAPGRAERVMLTGLATFVVVVPAAVLIPLAQPLEDPLAVACPTKRWCASGVGQ